MVKLRISDFGSVNDLASNRLQAITLTNIDPNMWHYIAAMVRNELAHCDQVTE